jgi:transmembrane sensor
MQPEKLAEFFNRFSQNLHSEKEHQEFLNWLYTLPEQQVKDVLEMYQHIASNVTEPADLQLIQKIEDRLDAQAPAEKPQMRQLWPSVNRWVVAACLLVAFAVGGYFLFDSPVNGPAIANKPQKTAILQGGNKAILRLANGSKIILDSVKTGEIAKQGGAIIVKTKDGKVIFDASNTDSKPTDEIAFNTLSTPRGGQYMVKLPDGSAVWLNSSSSLKFPTSFSANERVVELTGEAYFEVAKNPLKPFKVKTAQQMVEVLGTHFNINAYDDEPSVATTLLEGSVKVSQNSSGKTLVLKPGQQARLDNDLRKFDVDASLYVDWKDGYFKFTREDIHSILRKAARWYDVDVSYSGNITKEGFVGIVPRSKDIYELLNALKLTGLINYKVEGRHVTIMP